MSRLRKRTAIEKHLRKSRVNKVVEMARASYMGRRKEALTFESRFKFWIAPRFESAFKEEEKRKCQSKKSTKE